MRKFLSLLVVLLTTFTSAWAVKHDYVVIGGLRWATKNLGATTVADSPETAYGTYYSWAATSTIVSSIPWSSLSSWGTAITPTFIEDKSGGYTQANDPTYNGSSWAYNPTAKTTRSEGFDSYDAAKTVLGGNWRMPSATEFKALADACGGASSAQKTAYTASTITTGGIYWINPTKGSSVTIDGVEYKVPGRLFVATADPTKRVFFPATGFIYNTSLYYAGTDGNYWSSSRGTLVGYSYRLYFSNSSVSPQDYGDRYRGFSIRAVSDPVPEYLCFTAEADNSSVTFNWESGSGVQKSTDGTNFTAYTAGTTITLNNGDKVYFKGTGVKTGLSKHFTMTGKIAASGDVTSLTNGTGGDATLTDYCYSGMFSGCTSLTAAPELPAKTLKESCYQNMFDGCTSLTVAPELPATTLARTCYYMMFKDCTSLTTAPELKATPLAKACYMFMFSGCTSLTAAPELPATTLAIKCYIGMFNGCAKLSKVTVKFTDWGTSLLEDGAYPTTNWLYNAGTDASVTSHTFICPAGLTLLTTRSVSDVPSGWAVEKPVSTVADLNTAVGNATAGETIQLTGDIPLTAELSVASGKDFTLDLNGHVLKQTGTNMRVIKNLGTLTIADNSTAKTGKITGGNLTNYSGAGIYNEGTLNINGGTISGNTTGEYGGAIYDYNGTLTITGGTITGNTATKSGGGIDHYCDKAITVGGTAVIEGNKLTDGTKSDLDSHGYKLNISTTTPLAEGAKIGIAASSTGQFTSNGSADDAKYFFADNDKYGIRYNTAGYLETYYKQVSTKTELATAVANAQKDDVIKLAADINLTAELTIESTKNFTLDLNGHVLKQTTAGKRVILMRNSTQTIIDIIDSNPEATHTGDLANIKGGVLTGGQGVNGGCIFNSDGTLNITGGTITGNTASSSGGGICNDNGTVTLKNVTISNNTASSGGAIHLFGAGRGYGGTITVEDCTISGNSASYGGGIYNDRGNLKLIGTNQCTITGNTSTVDTRPSGGVYSFINSNFGGSTSNTLKGKVIIKDNTTAGKAANLCLNGMNSPTPQPITIDEAGIAGSEIGVTTMVGSTVGAYQFTTGTVTATDAQYFFADDADKYKVNYNTSGYLEIVLKQVDPGFSLNEETATLYTNDTKTIKWTSNSTGAVTVTGVPSYMTCTINQASKTITITAGEGSADEDVNLVFTQAETESYTAATATFSISYKKHNWAEEWDYNEDGHWHNCTIEGCTEKDSYAVHGYGSDKMEQSYYICSTCGYENATRKAEHEEALEAAWLTSMIKDIVEKIDAIGTVKYTPECKARIDAARAAINQLGLYERTLVPNRQKLYDAEAEYERLKQIATGINDVNADADANKNGKFLENGKVVIYRNGRKYTSAGTQIR